MEKVSNLLDNKLRVASSIPGLNDKIQAKLDGFSDRIYWYIKFSAPLNPSSVSSKTMNVTDARGYRLNTEINYDAGKNCIALYPEDSYDSNQFYLLNISKKVQSENGVQLKQEIHVLFKLVENKISNYEVLKSNAKIPKPKKRPKDYDERFIDPNSLVRKPPRNKVYSFDKAKVEGENSTLLTLPIKMNVILGILGLLLAVPSIALAITPLLIVSLVVEGLGIAHIIAQLINKKTRSILAYNKGVKLFNKERYNGAEVYFKKALLLSPDNEVVEFALNKLSFYI